MPLSCRSLLVLAAALLTAPAAAPAQIPGPATPSPAAKASPPAADEWVLPGKNVENTRFSELTEITPANVGQLREVFTYVTGIKDGHEGQPIVRGNRMWVITPFPNRLIAFDITNPRAPRHMWTYTPDQDSTAYGKACCDRVNRGGVYSDGKIIYNTLDDHTVAVDAESGRQLWKTRLGDPMKGETMTMAPLLVDGKVIVGNSGGDMGVHGWLAALDASDGHIIWRAYGTGPDSMTLVGAGFQPPYASLRGKNLGTSTWPGQQWRMGGAAAWGWVSYDPRNRLIIYGTSNPGVWNPSIRPGRNLWSSTIFARNPDDGMARWAVQLTPHDMWDYDAVNESIVADLAFPTGTRRVLIHVDRNGHIYTIDAATGKLLVARPFVTVNWANGIDLATGQPRKIPAKETRQGVLTKMICPSSTGGRDQQPAAFSPRTGLLYTGLTNLCMDYGGMDVNYIAGTPYLGVAVKMYKDPSTTGQGGFLAWDPVRGRKVWEISERFPVWTGALVTASDVVFYGTQDGWFKAVNARTGKVLWRTHMKSGLIGNPITFRGPDGHQYVAVYSGVGGWYGVIVPGKFSPNDPYAALGIANAAHDLPQVTQAGGAVHIFALP